MGRSLEWRRGVRQLTEAGYRQASADEPRRPCGSCGETVSGRRIWRRPDGGPAAGLCRRCATIWSLVGRRPAILREAWDRDQVARIVVAWRAEGFDPTGTFRRWESASVPIILAAIDEWALRELVRLTPSVDRLALRWRPPERVATWSRRKGAT